MSSLQVRDGPFTPASKRAAIIPTDVVPTAVHGGNGRNRAQVSLNVARLEGSLTAAPSIVPTPFVRRQIPPLFPLSPASPVGSPAAGGGSSDSSGQSDSHSGSSASGGASGSQSQSDSASNQSSGSSQSQSQSQPQSQSQSLSMSQTSQSQSSASSASSSSPSSDSSSSFMQSNSISPSLSQNSTFLSQSNSPLPTDQSSSSSATSSGITTTLYSTVVTNIDGHEATSVIAIPTVLPYPSSPPSPSSKRGIIVGAAIGGAAFLIIIASLIIFMRRSEKVRLNYKKLRVFGRRRKNLLEDEDDDWMGGEGHGLTTTTRYRDYPTSTSSSTRRFGNARGASGGSLSAFDMSSPLPGISAGGIAVPPQSPYLLGMRASSSGSIFQEQVWPPPSENSRLVDPLVAASSQVDLGNIVSDVMGPTVAGMSYASGSGSNHPTALGSSTPETPSGHVSTPSSEALLPNTSSMIHSRLPSYGTAVALGASMPPARQPSYPQTPSKAREQSAVERAQSADSAFYDLDSRVRTLSVRNAGPMTPLSPVSSTQQSLPPSAYPKASGAASNWLERSPKRDSIT